MGVESPRERERLPRKVLEAPGDVEVQAGGAMVI